MRQSADVPWDAAAVDRLLGAALEEDLGRGDVTSRAVVPAGRPAVARVQAKDRLVIAGLGLVARLYDRLGRVHLQMFVADGDWVVPGTVILEGRGDAHTLLAGERTVLNFLQHLSGVATRTRLCVEALAGCGCIIRDTRKTLPGLRSLEKYAVRVGGGVNHRLRLDDGVLIKDNHAALAGGVGNAVEAARRALSGREIEVECRTLGEVQEALDAGADLILLDNMGFPDIARALAMIGARARTEASGGITPERVREVADLGVDFIAMGCLTHSAPAVDLSMDIRPDCGRPPDTADDSAGPASRTP
jgi:nicotinate-nucleotide pyrophosphorylase (carboxylating)